MFVGIYYPIQNKRQVAIFRITFDRNEIENCGFHHSKEQYLGNKYIYNSIGQASDQSAEFLKKISTNEISQTFS
jgi:hypothetical protein